MQRFLFRVEYVYADSPSSFEPVCVRAADDDESAARAEVTAATARYAAAAGATRTITLISVTADA